MRAVGLDEWFDLVISFQHSALHVEQHPIYVVDLPAMTPWVAGETTPPSPDYETDTWAALVRRRIDAGGVIDRVRIHRDEPTPYQQWLRWIARRHMLAGETHRYLTESAAKTVGVLPTAPFPGRDWWLLDGKQLLVFVHKEGELIGVELHCKQALISEALDWWHRAVAHAEFEKLATG